MGKTSIEWTDASWNPVVGCYPISPGCANCYAARIAATRLKNHPDYKGLAILENGDARFTGKVRFLPERLGEPLHWRRLPDGRARRIFVCDMGDLFHESVDGKWIDQVWFTMAKARHHTFQVLTKRPQRMRDYLARFVWTTVLDIRKWPLPNVWLGVSVENQHFADERIPLLLETPAAVRFISAEPLLGPVSLYGPSVPYTGLDWVICGGESGSGARAMHPDWARSLRDQCQAAGVPFFFKQWGAWAGCGIKMGKKKAGRLLDGREWNEYPTKDTNPGTHRDEFPKQVTR